MSSMTGGVSIRRSPQAHGALLRCPQPRGIAGMWTMGGGIFRKSRGTMKKTTILLTALLIYGCSTANTYKTPDIPKNLQATIVGKSVTAGLFDWEQYTVESIDGLTISYFFTGGTSHRIPVSPGEHKLVVYAQYNRSLGGPCPCEAFLQVPVNVESGVSYQVNGKVEGNQIQVWLEDAETSEKISQIFESNIMRSPRTTMIPIIIN